MPTDAGGPDDGPADGDEPTGPRGVAFAVTFSDLARAAAQAGADVPLRVRVRAGMHVYDGWLDEGVAPEVGLFLVAEQPGRGSPPPDEPGRNGVFVPWSAVDWVHVQ